MSYTQPTWKTTAAVLCILVSHSCQQPELNAEGGDVMQTVPQARTPQDKPVIEARPTYEPSAAIVMTTSSSDASPESKHADQAQPGYSATARSIPDVLAGNGTLEFTSTDTTINKASNRKITGKRSPEIHTEGREALAKRQKQESKNSDWEVLLEKTTIALDKLDSDQEESYEYDYVFNRLDEIFSKHKDILKKTNKSAALLHQSASKGHLGIVKYLVEDQEVDPKSTDEKEATALHHSASEGHLSIVKYLVETQKVDAKSTDKEGANALHYAAAGRQETNNRRVVAYLVQEQGLELCKTFNTGSSALGLAVATTNLSIVEYWIEYYSSGRGKKEKWNGRVKSLTESALEVAKYRQRNKQGEQESQAYIVGLLDEFLKLHQ